MSHFCLYIRQVVANLSTTFLFPAPSPSMQADFPSCSHPSLGAAAAGIWLKYAAFIPNFSRVLEWHLSGRDKWTLLSTTAKDPPQNPEWKADSVSPVDFFSCSFKDLLHPSAYSMTVSIFRPERGVEPALTLVIVLCFRSPCRLSRPEPKNDSSRSSETQTAH